MNEWLSNSVSRNLPRLQSPFQVGKVQRLTQIATLLPDPPQFARPGVRRTQSRIQRIGGPLRCSRARSRNKPSRGNYVQEKPGTEAAMVQSIGFVIFLSPPASIS